MLSTDIAKDIQKAVDRRFDEQVDFTAELGGFPSTRGNEATVQDFMATAFAQRGLEVDRWKLNVNDIQHLHGFSPGLVYGLRSVDVHGFNEWVDLESVRKSIQAIALFMANWCGLEKIQP